MRGAARLDADSHRRQLGKEFLDLAAPQLPPQYRLLVLVNSMNLKDMFGRIQTNPDNRRSDGSPGCVVARSQPGTFDAVGGRPHQQSLSRCCRPASEPVRCPVAVLTPAISRPVARSSNGQVRAEQ